ncbi:polysaccharide export protein [Thalassococcus sp. CAU 1522]|uniref:Polysaccharide export protein n=1 Tax=Thalassococcus arenae TaxID=2851652 RepID=A0ABS6N5S7_9RHOB|nr:polysaccharide biosynthesis/export family protein [Thalassococcus arenae]MBV2359356.1 polysaccharide export protein [Thalassococcus arenae]
MAACLGGLVLHKRIRGIALVFVCLAVAACSLPRGAAVQSEVLKEADSKQPTFQVVQVTRENTPVLANWPATGWHGHFHWPKAGSISDGTVIRTGDKVTVTIWDSQENSLLTSPGEKFTRLADMEVSADGTIFLPYVNEVNVRGLTPASARSRIQANLEPIVPSAQVQLSVVSGEGSAVDAAGGLAQPGSYPMPSRNYKILALISDAGGIPPTLRNPRVRLLRGTTTYQISADQLFESGSRNILLQPRDTVVVEEDDRSFVALGATGNEDLIYFPKDELNALQALSLMGGLSDLRADPKGVLVLREYRSKDLRADAFGPNMQQVVFSFDLTSADGLFAARNFMINPDDIVLATESPVTSAQTIFGLIGSVLGLSGQVAATAG